MINFVLAIMAFAVPVLLVMWRKRYYEGMLIGHVIFILAYLTYNYQVNAGPVGWITNYPINEGYYVRWMLPTFINGVNAMLNISHTYITWIFISSALWWLGLCLFQRVLVNIGFSRRLSMFGAIFPLITFSTAYGSGGRIIMTADCINWLIVMTVTWATYQWRQNDKRWLILVPFALFLAVVVSFPVPAGISWHDRLFYFYVDPVELVAAGGAYWIFIAITLKNHRTQIPDYVRINAVYLIAIVAVMVVAVDWDRWFMLSAFLWVPLVLIALEKVFDDG